MDLHTRTCRFLEWDRLKEYLEAEALTPCSKVLCLQLEPHRTRTLVEALLQETDEALSLIRARSGLSQEGLPDLQEALSRLKAGANLTGKELLEVKTTLRLARASKASLSLLDSKNFPKLSSFILQLHALEPLASSIESMLDDSGQVKDDASAHLMSLKKQVQRIDNQIKDELLKIIHSSVLSKSLQEPIYTHRNGRYVLPVNASLRQSIPGIVHDSSSSGLTAYVEPMIVVELANDSRLKEAEIEREIARILAELSTQAASHADEIETSFNALVELDFIMARARLAARYNGTLPELSPDGKVYLHNARHPLLMLQDLSQAPHIVPNDIILNEESRTLIITGPNTGGKTVYLKTAGLLSLMLRAGLLLPVSPGSTAAIFPDIYADIGDEQSIEQNLSTFSAHMTNIVEIVGKAHQGSLVLLDEIGAGTDPREGAALARSILEHLNTSGAFTISTTHFGELKILAYTQAGFLNASLDFDEASLSPTYHLRLGVPGSSKATTIAGRLGLQSTVVQRANELLAEDARDVQQVIEQLEQKLKEATTREEEARRAFQNARQLEEKARQDLDYVNVEQEAERRTYAQQMESEFKTARETLRELIARLQKEPTSQHAQLAQGEMELLKSQLKWLSANQIKQSPADLSLGQKVRVKSLNQIATVEDLPSKPERQAGALISVRAGSLRIKVPASDLEVISTPPPQQLRRSGTHNQSAPSRTSVRHSTASSQNSPHTSVFVRTSSNTLDLRGQRVEAALANLERFLDEASVNFTSPLMIIHGHGTGAMKSAVREYLQQSSYMSHFRPGETYEGGDGVTIVEL